jgi:hypothetical protein
MSLVSDVISQLRLELTDTNSARWSDANLITWIRKAISRTSPILYRNSVQFSRSSATVTTVAGQAAYTLPTGTPTTRNSRSARRMNGIPLHPLAR